jgi:hypothetical protein
VADTYANPTLEAAVRMEVQQKKSGCCVRSQQVMGNIYLCTVNKTFPRCRREKKGFLYDAGEG